MPADNQETNERKLEEEWREGGGGGGKEENEEREWKKAEAAVVLAGLIAAAFRNSNARAIARSRRCGKSRALAMAPRRHGCPLFALSRPSSSSLGFHVPLLRPRPLINRLCTFKRC